MPVEKQNPNQNTVFVGSKPLVNYVKSVLIQLNKPNVSEVIIKSRGKFISKAVDIAEIVKRYNADSPISVKNIEIASETFKTNDKETKISTMNLVIGR